MSTNVKPQELQKLEKAGKFLAERLNQARKRKGFLRCPVCHRIFDGTHLIKCPGCRTLISKTFQKVRSCNSKNTPKIQSLNSETFQEVGPLSSETLQKVLSPAKPEKMQLDFFA